MRIERIDDKTVKCFLSNQELEEYKIDYKDFLTRSEKAKEVVQEIMHQAIEEVGYKPPKFAFDLQIMLVPEQGLVLTLSEKDPMETKEGANLMEYLKEMKKLFMGQETQKQEEKKVATPAKHPEQVIFHFDTLGEVMKLAMVIPRSLRVKSSLYVMNGEYLLYLQKGAASYERYSKACIQAMEFGGIYNASPEGILYVLEHGECIVEEHALRKMHPKES